MPPQGIQSPIQRMSLFGHGRFFRVSRLALVVSVAALAGCATTGQGPQQASSTSSLQNNQYLVSTRSDPLGAFLRSRENGLQSGLQSTVQGSANPALASTALSVLGIKYRFGGEAPSTGFDCSGLVIYAAEKSLGLKLPRESRDIAREGIAVKNHELKKGDLVFFNTRGHRFSHVGIYLGNRKFVHAPRSGSVVRIENMDIGYWKKRYNGARRLVASTGQASQ